MRYKFPPQYHTVDAHNHVWMRADKTLRTDDMEATIAKMDTFGIERAVVSCPITSSAHVPAAEYRCANNVVLEAMKCHPDRFIGFCFVDPADPGAVAEIKRCVKAGMAGVKLYHQRLICDEAQRPIMECAARLGIPVLMHAGKVCDEYTMKQQPRISNAAHFLKALEMFPDTMLIQGHIGGGGDWEWNLRTLEEMDSDNYFIDISGSVIDAGIVRRTVNAVGIDHVLFATDCSMEEGVGKVQAADLTDDEYMKLFSGNMKRIFARRRA
jgi:predicted TIM-barrel fold metal-dependent hydrolase